MLSSEIKASPGVLSVKAMQRAERERVQEMLRRDQVNAPRINAAERVKRPGEHQLAYQARMVALKLTERPIGEAIMTPESEQHGEYVDANVVGPTGGIAVTKRNNMVAPIKRMFDDGKVTQEQLDASIDIATVAEIIKCAVSIKTGSLEPRVDSSGSGRDALIESLWMARLEATYTRWREQLPTPRAMFIDMVETNQGLVAIARSYNVPWRKARKQLLAALDRWIDFKERAHASIDQQDLDAIHLRIEHGWPE